MESFSVIDWLRDSIIGCSADPHDTLRLHDIDGLLARPVSWFVFLLRKLVKQMINERRTNSLAEALTSDGTSSLEPVSREKLDRVCTAFIKDLLLGKKESIDCDSALCDGNPELSDPSDHSGSFDGSNDGSADRSASDRDNGSTSTNSCAVTAVRIKHKFRDTSVLLDFVPPSAAELEPHLAFSKGFRYGYITTINAVFFNGLAFAGELPGPLYLPNGDYPIGPFFVSADHTGPLVYRALAPIPLFVECFSTVALLIPNVTPEGASLSNAIAARDLYFRSANPLSVHYYDDETADDEMADDETADDKMADDETADGETSTVLDDGSGSDDNAGAADASEQSELPPFVRNSILTLSEKLQLLFSTLPDGTSVFGAMLRHNRVDLLESVFELIHWMQSPAVGESLSQTFHADAQTDTTPVQTLPDAFDDVTDPPARDDAFSAKRTVAGFPLGRMEDIMMICAYSVNTDARGAVPHLELETDKILYEFARRAFGPNFSHESDARASFTRNDLIEFSTDVLSDTSMYTNQINSFDDFIAEAAPGFVRLPLSFYGSNSAFKDLQPTRTTVLDEVDVSYIDYSADRVDLADDERSQFSTHLDTSPSPNTRLYARHHNAYLEAFGHDYRFPTSPAVDRDQERDDSVDENDDLRQKAKFIAHVSQTRANQLEPSSLSKLLKRLFSPEFFNVIQQPMCPAAACFSSDPLRYVRKDNVVSVTTHVDKTLCPVTTAVMFGHTDILSEVVRIANRFQTNQSKKRSTRAFLLATQIPFKGTEQTSVSPTSGLDAAIRFGHQNTIERILEILADFGERQVVSFNRFITDRRKGFEESLYKYNHKSAEFMDFAYEVLPALWVAYLERVERTYSIDTAYEEMYFHEIFDNASRLTIELARFSNRRNRGRQRRNSTPKSWLQKEGKAQWVIYHRPKKTPRCWKKWRLFYSQPYRRDPRTDFKARDKTVLSDGKYLNILNTKQLGISRNPPVTPFPSRCD